MEEGEGGRREEDCLLQAVDRQELSNATMDAPHEGRRRNGGPDLRGRRCLIVDSLVFSDAEDVIPLRVVRIQEETLPHLFEQWLQVQRLLGIRLTVLIVEVVGQVLLRHKERIPDAVDVLLSEIKVVVDPVRLPFLNALRHEGRRERHAIGQVVHVERLAIDRGGVGVKLGLVHLEAVHAVAGRRRRGHSLVEKPIGISVAVPEVLIIVVLVASSLLRHQRRRHSARTRLPKPPRASRRPSKRLDHVGDKEEKQQRQLRPSLPCHVFRLGETLRELR